MLEALYVRNMGIHLTKDIIYLLALYFRNIFPSLSA